MLCLFVQFFLSEPNHDIKKEAKRQTVLSFCSIFPQWAKPRHQKRGQKTNRFVFCYIFLGSEPNHDIEKCKKDKPVWLTEEKKCKKDKPCCLLLHFPRQWALTWHRLSLSGTQWALTRHVMLWLTIRSTKAHYRLSRVPLGRHTGVLVSSSWSRVPLDESTCPLPWYSEPWRDIHWALVEH